MSLGHGAKIVRNGLVLHLDAASVRSYPGSGTSFYNLAPMNRNLRANLINGAVYSDGGIVFDGTNDSIRIFNDDTNSYTIGTQSDISPTTQFTIEQTFKITTVGTNTYYGLRNQLLRKAAGASTINYWTQVDSDTSFKFYVRDNAETLKSVSFTVPSMTNNIVTVVITVDNSNIKCYYNGEYIGQQTMSSNPVTAYSNDTMGVGDLGVSETYFTGTYYGCKVYNRTLNSDEVKQNYFAYRGRYEVGSVIEPPAATDPYWDNVTLLLSFDGNNVDTSTTDKSLAATPITFYGDAQLSTAQAKFGTTSLFVDGSGDYIRADDAFNTLTSVTDSVTIEFWIYPTVVNSSTFFGGINADGSGANTLLLGFTSLYIDGAQTNYPTSPFTTNEWQLFTYTYNGAYHSVYRNGELVHSVKNILGIPLSSCVFGIGAEFDAGDGGSPGNYLTGYIDELRVTAGINRYFPNIDLQEPTMSGDSFSSQTSLLLNFEGADGSTTFTDESNFNHTATVLGDAQIDTSVVKFGSGSLRLDGVGDGLTYPSTNILPNTGDFTIELAVYPNVVENWQCLCQLGDYNNSNGFTLISGASETRMEIRTTAYNTGTPLIASQWNTVVVQRKSGKVYMWVNGRLLINGSANTGDINTISTFDVGYSDGTFGVDPLNGYIDGIRFTTGVARYPSEATVLVPTEAFPAQ